MNRVRFQRIVCAVDLSHQSVANLKRAVQLAHRHGGELLVVDVTNGRHAQTESAQRTVTDAFSSLRRFTSEAPHQAVAVRCGRHHPQDHDLPGARDPVDGGRRRVARAVSRDPVRGVVRTRNGHAPLRPVVRPGVREPTDTR